MKDAAGCTPAWLPFLPMEIPEGASPAGIARSELRNGLRALGLDRSFAVDARGAGDAYCLSFADNQITVSGGEPGVLYGAYEALSLAARGLEPRADVSRPFWPLRLLNHWDNPDGSVERGYAGRSLFFRSGKLDYDERRIHRYARMLASVGINGVCLNNVNVAPPADGLIADGLLPGLAAIAGILRRYGVRLIAAVDFGMPVRHGPGTADPLDGRVARWWALRADRVYQAIPDLLGFLVKADSEHRAGPNSYRRSHAQGANMLARALKPHGGRVFWRAFVYDCQQDWRDASADRPRAAYECFAPLDGRFDDHVVLQVKNGPYDFQVREPASPLLLGMDGTRKALELQLAQEYTGQQVDLFFMARQWADLFDTLPQDRVDAVCAVSNLGDDGNWAGHDLALANLFAYGRMAWAGCSDPEALALEWAALSFGEAGPDVARLLLKSPGVYEQYASPLGLGWMVNPQTHYGPSPEGYEFSPWGTYHRAGREAIGVDRSSRGTGFTRQYPPALAELYDDPSSCPEKLLLFFHRLRYDYRMKDGRTLLQRVYDDHFEGAQGARELRDAWRALRGRVPEDVFGRVAERFDLQLQNAENWRDVINTWFHRHSGVPDADGREIHP